MKNKVRVPVKWSDLTSNQINDIVYNSGKQLEKNEYQKLVLYQEGVTDKKIWEMFNKKLPLEQRTTLPTNSQLRRERIKSMDKLFVLCSNNLREGKGFETDFSSLMLHKS